MRSGTSDGGGNGETYSWETDRVVGAYTHPEESHSEHEKRLFLQSGLLFAVDVQVDNGVADEGQQGHPEDEFMATEVGYYEAADC